MENRDQSASKRQTNEQAAIEQAKSEHEAAERRAAEQEAATEKAAHLNEAIAASVQAAPDVFDTLRQQCASRIVVELRSTFLAEVPEFFDQTYNERDYPGSAVRPNDRRKDFLPWQRMAEEFGQFQFAALGRPLSQDRLTPELADDGLGDITAAEIHALYQVATPALVDSFGDGVFDRIPHPLAFVRFDVPRDADADTDRVSRLRMNTFLDELRGYESVADAYVEGLPERPTSGILAFGQASQQTYLKNGPFGIGAEFALGQNLVGAQVRVGDVEQGWMTDHEDLAGIGGPVWGRSLPDARIVEHGTAVLGILNASLNTLGCVGIASGAKPLLVSQWTRDNEYNTLAAIIQAIRRPNGNQARLRAGDILLIEAQTRVTEGGPLVPIEVQSAARAGIMLAHALGITVVEAAGNGGVELDKVEDHRQRRIFDRSDLGQFIDSRAIMVGAAVSDGDATAPTYARWGLSNFGSRIDCFAHGDKVYTLSSYGFNDNVKYFPFPDAGTSAAAAIIAGVAAVVQGVARQQDAAAFYLPGQMRSILTDPNTSTATRNANSQGIGVMPDLAKLLPVLPAPEGDQAAFDQPAQPPGVPRLVAPKLPPRTWANKASGRPWGQ